MKIPETWKLIKFGDLKGENGLISDGDWIVSQNMNPNGEVRLIQLADIGLGEFLNRSNKFINLDKFQELNCTEIKENDILISRMADPIGRACIFPKLPQKAITAVDVTILRTDKTIAEPYYVMYLCNSSYFLEQAKSLATGTTRSRITRRNLEKIQIPLPPISEQRRIVEILDQADALRKQRIHANEISDRILPALFLKMFGNPATNPMGWDVEPIKNLGKITTGNTPSRKHPEYYGNDIEWIKSDNINTPFHILTNATEGLSKKGIEVARIVPKGSILVTCIAGSPSCIGNTALADRDVSFNQQINAITPKNTIDSYFLYTQILLLKKTIQSLSTNAMKGMVSKGRFQEINVINPPFDLQRKFGKDFNNYLKSSQQQNKSQIIIEKLFDILLNKAFSGELTAKWREGHLKELLAEMEYQNKALNQQTELF